MPTLDGMHHAKFLSLFLYTWLSKITSQLLQAPTGFENILFGELGPLSPPPQSIGMPINVGNIFGQARPQTFGMSPGGGFAGPMPLPFPLFPMPCDPICENGGLFFTNIMIQNLPQEQQSRPNIGNTGGGSGSGGGMMTTMRPGGNMGGGSNSGVTSRPGGSNSNGMSGGGSGSGMSGSGSGYTSMGGGSGGIGGIGLLTTTMRPNVNAQFIHFVPNWCTGWCRFFWRPQSTVPQLPPALPPIPAASSYPRPMCLLYSWLGL